MKRCDGLDENDNAEPVNRTLKRGVGGTKADEQTLHRHRHRQRETQKVGRHGLGLPGTWHDLNEDGIIHSDRESESEREMTYDGGIMVVLITSK